METLFVIALLVAWWLWSSKQKRVKEGRWDLAHPRYDDVWADDAGLRWEFDLENMTAMHTWWSIPDRKTRPCTLRRVGASRWETRLTSEAWKAEMGDLDASKDKPGLRDVVPARIELLKNGPVWEPLRDDFAAKLENDYQRFLHGRS